MKNMSAHRFLRFIILLSYSLPVPLLSFVIFIYGDVVVTCSFLAFAAIQNFDRLTQDAPPLLPLHSTIARRFVCRTIAQMSSTTPDVNYAHNAGMISVAVPIIFTLFYVLLFAFYIHQSNCLSPHFRVFSLLAIFCLGQFIFFDWMNMHGLF